LAAGIRGENDCGNNWDEDPANCGQLSQSLIK